jgi:hypothetical protein
MKMPIWKLDIFKARPYWVFPPMGFLAIDTESIT